MQPRRPRRHEEEHSPHGHGARSHGAIRKCAATDADALARIYNHYVVSTIITFEEEPIDGAEMARRIDDVAAATLPWLVAEREGDVVGFAYASKWKGRCAYRYSVETTVYVDHRCPRQGLGSRLYDALLPLLKEASLHAAIGGIALPNDASVALHERVGFEKIAHFREVGFKFGRWIDVGYWEKLL
jgi:phosphinothricin acetyltransferase